MKLPPQPCDAQSLHAEIAELRARLEEAEETLRAIRAGEVGSVVVQGDAGPQIFALQGLEAEQNRFRGDMLAQVSDAVIAVDNEERITFINPAAESQYGVRGGDVLGRSLTAMYTRHWLSPEAEAGMRTALNERGEWRGDLIHRTLDGRELHVESRATALRDPDGARTGYVASIRDITQRHRAEAALRRNTALFSEIIEQAPGGVYVVDAQFRVAQMNAETLPFFASANPLIGRDFDEVLDIVWGPEIGRQCASIFRHTLATGERYVSPRFSERRHDNGEEQAFEWETHRITLPDGQHGVVCYFQHVTARERAEAALRLSNERFDLAVKCSHAMLWQQDLDLRFTWLHNPAPGIDGSDAVGKWDEDLLERSEDAAVIVALKREVIRSGVGVRHEFYPHIQGVRRCFEVVMEPLRDAAGVIAGLTGAAIDITERKRVEEALRQRERRFRGIFDSAFQFIGLMTPDGTLLEANRTALEAGGLRAENMIGKPFWECGWWTLTERTGRELRNAIERAASGELVRYEVDVRVAEGQVITIDFSIKPIRDEAGRVVLLLPEGRDITGLKQVEENLRLTNNRFELAVRASTAVLWQQDLDLRFTWLYNPVRGFNGLDAVGKRDADLLERAEDVAGIESLKREVIRSGVGMHKEFSPHIEGVVRCFDLLMEPLRDAAGNITGITGAAIDITERKRAEAARHELERNYRALAAASSEVAYRMSADWSTMMALDGRQLVASSEQPLTDWAWLDQNIPRDEHPRIKQAISEAIARKTLFELEHRVWRPDGAIGWTLSRAVPILDENESVIAWFGAASDITERKQSQQVLADRTELLNGVLEGTTDVIFVKDLSGRVLLANAACAAAFSSTPEQVVGRTNEELMPPDLANGVRQHDEAVVASGSQIQREETFPVAGEPRDFLTLKAPLRDGGGRIVGVLGISRDITERRRNEEQLRRLATELSEADGRKDEFLATLAHELRNPLAPIRAGLHIIKLAGGNPGMVKESVAIMERQVSQMAHLIDDLMDLARISGGKIVLKKARLSLATVIQDAVDTVRPLIETRGHTLTLDMPPEPICVNADRTRLAQVLGNLLNNAAKYTERGGRIRVAVERHGGDVVVAVEDNGVGISVPMLTRVFDMFAQADRSLEESQGGLGIGLNIVKRLVEMHGGSIVAQSGGHGAGSRFVVRLPIALSPKGEQRDQEAEGVTAPAPRRILVVDDNRDAADSLAVVLKFMGHELQTAYDGLQALEVAPVFRPDLVLLDIGMPKLNGYDTARRIREQSWGKGMVLVALTGWGQGEDIRKSEEAGFDEHLVKPVDPAALQTLLGGIVSEPGRCECSAAPHREGVAGLFVDASGERHSRAPE